MLKPGDYGRREVVGTLWPRLSTDQSAVPRSGAASSTCEAGMEGTSASRIKNF